MLEVYRRRKDSPDAEWHLHTQCPNWPEIDYIQSGSLTPEEREWLCLECKRLETKMFRQRAAVRN